MDRQKIIAIGVFAVVAPWLVLALMRPSGPVPTLVAIPADDRELSAPVSEAFNRAPFFLIADLQTSTARAIKNPYWRDRKAMGLKAAYLLMDEGVGALLVRSVKPAIHNALYSRGVRLYDAGSGTALQAVQRFKNGMLADLGPPRLPHHIDASHIPLLAPPCPYGTAEQAPVAGALPPENLRATAIPGFGIHVVSGPVGGAKVVGVVPGSRAERAGLQSSDLIVGLGQTVVQGASQFQRLAALVKNDIGVMLTVERAGRTGQVWMMPETRRFLPNRLARR